MHQRMLCRRLQSGRFGVCISMLYAFRLVSLMSFLLLTNFALQGCDNTIQNGGTTVDSSLSVLACPGKGAEICGGPDVLTVYRYIGS